MNKKIIAVSALIAILVVGAFAGTIFYYNSKIANLSSQISNISGQLTNVTTQLTNLSSANLVAKLSIAEVPNNYNDTGRYTGLNYLSISGNVTNTGRGTAYNTGLHVVAYTATGTLEINMTVPLGVGGYGNGVDNSTHALGTTISSPMGAGEAAFPPDSPSTYITSLASYAGLNVLALCVIAIYHEGTVTDWTVTPVWTNSP